jgi:hypothetical protein
MVNNRWSNFGLGVVLGLLLGCILTGGYFWPKLQEARAEALEAREHEEDRIRDRAVLRGELEKISIELKRDSDKFEALKKAMQSK